MKLKKILTLMCCAVLLVCISVGATVAYLTSKDSVTNTFTVGALSITLDEAKVNVNGEKLNKNNSVAVEDDELAARVKANAYHLVPGHNYVKDPVVHFAAGNDAAWVFVKVENGISAIESKANGYVTIENQILANGWTTLAGQTGVYYKDVAANNAEDATVVDLKVFQNFTVDTAADVANYASAKITVNAYAIQRDGFNDAASAWTEVSKPAN